MEKMCPPLQKVSKNVYVWLKENSEEFIPLKNRQYSIPKITKVMFANGFKCCIPNKGEFMRFER